MPHTTFAHWLLMIVLHGLWSPQGRFYIWGEDLSQARLSHSIPREAHPFACTIEQLTAHFDALDFPVDGSEQLLLLLPTGNHLPEASSHIADVDDSPDEREDLTLNAWSVPAVYFEVVPALGFLTTVSTGEMPGIRLADSLHFWVEATKLVLELLTKGCFLPGIQGAVDNYTSLWRPVFPEDSDKSKLSALAESIPPVCRALLVDGETHFQGRELIESFVTTAVHELVRIFLRRTELLPTDYPVPTSPQKRVAHAWICSLTSNNHKVFGTEFELATLEAKLRKWSGALLVAKARFELRTKITVVPPKNTESDDVHLEQDWKLVFGLQDLHDSAKYLPASELWAGRLSFLQHSEHTPEMLEERLLTDIARASIRIPSLERALETQFPSEIRISLDEAYRFLREAPKALEAHSIIVGIPSWWKSPNSRFGLSLTVTDPELATSGASTRADFLGVEQLLEYNWSVSIDNQKLDIETFRELVRQKTPLIQVGNTWVELHPDQVNATLRFLEQRQNQSRMTVFEALQLGLGLVDDPGVFPIVDFNAEGTLQKLLSRDIQSAAAVEQPLGFNGSLRHYQLEGLAWLSFLKSTGIGGCLADDMGLGKTIQLLSLLQLEREQSPTHRVPPTLLIVPMSILDNWQQEATRFTKDISVYIHHGPLRLAGDAFYAKIGASDLIITTYSLAHRDEEIFSNIAWGRIVLDEAQNIKNINTKQTKAIRRIGRSQIEKRDGQYLCQRLALTGTPLENHLDELWSIFDFLNPGLFGTLHQFRRRFSVPIERYRNKESAEALSRAVQPFILRRLKTDRDVINDLPEKIDIDVFTKLTEEQAALYQQTLDRMLHDVDQASGMHRKGLVLATITRLKQICNHPTLYLKDGSHLADRSGKLQRLEELIEVILAEKDKVLIFTQFAQMGTLLRPYLAERFNTEVLYLHGTLQRKVRERVIEKFQAPDGPSIFVLSLKAGGFGLNLTQANQVIHYDQWWNPAVQQQATDRAYRIGQTQNVQVRTFICKGTLEERIYQMLQHKRDLANEIVGSTKNVITQMSTEELRDLLKLYEP